MARLPRWIRTIGLLESLFGFWGLYAIWSLLASSATLNLAGQLGLAAAWSIAIGSVVAGLLLASGDSRAMRAMLWLLGFQSVRVVLPGFVWLVSLGWTANLELYLAGQDRPDGQDIAVLIGSHDFKSHIALNVLTLAPLLALFVWRRHKSSTANEDQATPAPY